MQKSLGNSRCIARAFLSLFCMLFFLSSCGEQKKNIVFYANNSNSGDSVETVTTNDTIAVPPEGLQEPLQVKNDNEVDVPFIEQDGEMYIDVTVNGKLTVKMILDSGCSTTLISIAEARYLYEKGCITEDDFLGTTQTQIADGSIGESMVVNLRELVISDKIVCYNVTATVAENAKAPLLLGNEVLNRVPSYSVDNENKLIRFMLRLSLIHI